MPDRKSIQIATRHDLGNLIVDGSTDTTALAAPTASVKYPTLGTIIEIGTAPLMRFIFGATDADDETVNYQIIGWYKVAMPAGVADTWFGVVLAKGAFTAGSLAITGITTGFFADTITDTVTTLANDTYITLANHVAMLTVDTQNAKVLSIVTDLGTAAKAYAWATPGEFAM